MSKPIILVVEDDMHLMEGIRDILEINDYHVLTAANGAAGLDVLEAQPRPPDLIVSDIMMPRMDGYDFFHEVRSREHWVAIPFIFLTAKGERDDIKRGKSMGAEDYVVKPFDADELLVAVSAKLKRRQELDAVRLTEVSNIKHNILTIINHEYRTPLTYIVAYADMLERDADELSVSDMRAFLHGLNAGANRLRRLVENFILLVELETGSADRTFAWRSTIMTNYLPLLRVVEHKYLDLAEEKGYHIQVSVDDNLLPIRADVEYLNAALECLVDNAIKFSTRQGSVIHLRAYLDGAQVCLCVSDQGRGIPDHEKENIFQTFYQIDRERFEDQGAGAGLAIVRGIVRLHGGSVTVDSVYGEGSTFIVALPVQEVNVNA